MLTPYRSIFQPSGCLVDHPVLQCVQIKTMEPKAGEANPVQRFRVVLSDIRNFIQTMIATSQSNTRNVQNTQEAYCVQLPTRLSLLDSSRKAQ